MGIAEDFQTFCSNIVVKQEKQTRIATRRGGICKHVNSDFWDSESATNHSFYGGSYGRGTAVQATSDVDLLCILPAEVFHRFDNYNGNGQSALLQAVRASIRARYPSTDIGASGQVVVVSFGDDVTFEVVPCFERRDGSYTFADANNGGRWRITNPKAEIGAIADMDRACNGNLKNLCQMARAWRDQWNIDMNGLLIDTLAYKFIKDWANRDKSFLYYDWMSRDFFQFLSRQSRSQSYWLAPGSNQQVSRGGAFVDKAAHCYGLACEAIEYAKNNRPYSEHEAWRKIYGTSYPAN